ncbi:MAG: leucine-rich repeat protein [Agathobacter sp.]|nr:leucine-rich repeat protein [Agathobacter sp.]
MKRNTFAKVMRSAFAYLLIFGLVAQMLPTTAIAADSEFSASFIEKLEDLKVDYTDYLDNSVVLHLPDGVTNDDEISVIITVDNITIMEAYEGTDKSMSFKDYALESEDAAEITADINEKKADILSRLDELGIEYTVGEDYNTLLSGFAVTIKAGDFASTCSVLKDGESAIVGEEYESCKTELVENSVSIYEDTGIFDSSDSGYDGSGMVVAVLDTGLDSNHSAFSVENFTSKTLGLTYDEVKKVLKDTVASTMVEGLSVDDVYINEKVPFGFDYADEDPDPYSTHNNHGTHVSGVIVGKDDTITGVAPNAQLVAMKIFSDVMDTARSEWILAALEDCVVLGVDVINMSLGTACGFSRESDEEILNGVYDKIREAGISVIVAASNSYSSAYGSDANGNLGLTSNPDTGTVGSPGTYEGTMSVASISGTKTPYMLYNGEIIYFTESTDGGTEENNFFDTLLGDQDKIKIEYVTIPGVGRSADYTGLDVEGKIVLVRRGSNTFEEKAIIAQEQGAAGIIIYNNVSGDIKMNVGDATLAVCSISQDDGEVLAAKEKGTLEIARKQTSGPFISDFSSWGPTPDLGIKPEITAHGGNILSAVTGGSYDRLSGTSMACPNLAGVVVLLRQYVVENFPEVAKDEVKVTALVYQLLMSTADIALNTNGSPYAVRKQGAGLANLANALATTAYITTKDADGNEMDKTKIELGDDPDKTGKYEMTFTINNFGKKTLSYELGAHIFTEGVSDTKTNAGETTVTEEAYILEGAKFEVTKVENGKLSGKKVTVKAGEAAEVTVKITLSKEDKKYLNESFENGMYVEGFITLDAKSGTKVDLNVPYLAFYGDWTEAPLFDLSYYDTNADELDEGIDEEDKTKADAYATRPIGGVSEDYVSYLGSYYFLQDEDDMDIPANMEHISLSNQDGTIHSLRYVWAGLLRNAQRVDVSIINKTTGEVVFQTTDTDVRKSYGDGGSIYPANIEIEFDTTEYNLPNNSEYIVRLEGYLDYSEDGGKSTNEKNVFEFPLTIDFEAPTVTDVKYYYEYDKSLKKNRLYAEVGVYDNHYAMSGQLGYVMMGEDENGNATPEIKLFEQYMTPIYSERNGTTYVKYELTDYIQEIKENAMNGNSFVLSVYDYALNYATYEIGLPDDYTDFYFEGLAEGLTLSPNEVYSLDPIVSPLTEWDELLEYTSSRPNVVRVVNNKLVAVRSGSAIIKVQDPTSDKSITFPVTVLEKGDDGYRRYDKPVADVFRLTGFYTSKAYYMLDSNDKKIGDTGSTNFFEGNYSLTLYPSESLYLTYDLDAYFPNDTEVVFESSNEAIVTVDASGHVTAQKEGFASISVKVLMDGKSTYYSENVSVEVKDPYVKTGSSLTHYYGLGGLVTIPEDLRLTEIGNFAFANFDYVAKTAEELAFDDAEATKQWFIGDSTITKVIIPEGVEKIGAYAFANLTALEEIVLPSTLEFIEYGAFYNCTSLKKISFSDENNLKVINQNAFENCALEGTLDLSSIHMISDYAFAGNQKLEGVKTGDTLISIGSYAFAGCKKLSDITITADRVKYGTYAFTGCESIKEFTVNATVLPEGMFYECDNLEKVIIGKEVNEIGAFAFRDTKISKFEIAKGNRTFESPTGEYIVADKGKELVAVVPTLTGEFSAANMGGKDKIEVVGNGAFSHNTQINSVVLPNVYEVGDNAFAQSESLSNVQLGKLEYIGEYAFFEVPITVLPEFNKGTDIGKYAFAYTDITSVTIPNRMDIAEGVFSECDKLTTVVIGNDVTLGKYAFGTNKDESFEIKSYDENGKKRFYYTFATALTSLTIGKNVVIGENAFVNAASLVDVTLGANAEIGYMAFYNCDSLANIDLSKAKSVGDYAFSGDVYNVCLDDAMAYAAVSSEGTYIYTYHAPNLTAVDLTSAESVGAYAFAYCRELVNVNLGEEIEAIPEYAFAGCIALQNINLDKIETIGDYAFMEDDLLTVDLSKAENIGEYAFVNNKHLTNVKLNEKGTDIAEGAFAYAATLANVENLGKAKNIGDYAFAYTSIVNIDLSETETVGTQAFMKESMTPVTVTLGEELVSLGDNPFAMCQVAPFSTKGEEEINDVKVEVPVYTYEISDTVKVVDGSLYSKVPMGWELIIYTGLNPEDVKIPEDTVRITSMAFAGSNVEMVQTPFTVEAIGHKAFFDCNGLHTVSLGSYNAPILEEEYDPTYYDSLEHVPGSGDYGTYTDYDGNEVAIYGMGLIPYFMWNVTGGLYHNVFYGANFVDYVGYVEDKLTLIRPVNGEHYDSYIMNQYFDVRIDGPQAPDEAAAAAIRAIKLIPERVKWEDKALVDAARAAYNKVATTLQQGLVSNYSDLVSAEQRIKLLDPANQEKEEDKDVVATPEEPSGPNVGLVALILFAVMAAIALFFKKEVKEIWTSDELVEIREAIKETLKPVTDKLKPVTDKLAPVFAKIGEKLAPVWAKVKEMCAKAGKALVALAGKAKDFAKKTARKTQDAVTKKAVAKFEAQKAAVEKELAEKMAAKEVSEDETEN